MYPNNRSWRVRERVAFTFEFLEKRTLLSAGVIDDLFGDDGEFIHDIALHMDAAYEVAVQEDGKIILAGERKDADGLYAGFVLRLNIDGTLDTSFGDSGVAIVPLEEVKAIVVRSNGQILVAGDSWGGIHSADFGFMQLNADGSVDTSFGTGGMVQYDVNGSTDWVENIMLLDDGGFVAVGKSRVSENNTDQWDSSIVMCNADGSLNTSFSGDGILTVSGSKTANDEEVLTTVEVTDDGKLLLGGWTRVVFGAKRYLSFTMIRVNADGTLDSTFSGDGMLRTDFGDDDGLLTDIAIQSDGKIVAIGDGSERTVVVRYNSDGSLDSGFADGGIFRLEPTYGEGGDHALMIRADGTIAFGGTSDTYKGYSAGLLSSDGTLIESFSASLGEEDELYLKSVAFQPDGSLVLAGFQSPMDYYEYSDIHGYGDATGWHNQKDVFATRLLLWEVPEAPEEEEVIPVDEDEETVDPSDEEQNEEPVDEEEEIVDPIVDDDEEIAPPSENEDEQSGFQPMLAAFSIKSINLFEKGDSEDTFSEEEELLEISPIE